MYLREVGCGAGDWVDLAQDRVQLRTYVRTVMNFRVPSNSLLGRVCGARRLRRLQLVKTEVTGSQPGRPLAPVQLHLSSPRVLKSRY